MQNFKPFYKSNMELLDQLKKNVMNELGLCTASETPYVFANLTSGPAAEKMTDLVIKKVLEQKIAISQAIVQIETELNPNSYVN